MRLGQVYFHEVFLVFVLLALLLQLEGLYEDEDEVGNEGLGIEGALWFLIVL